MRKYDKNFERLHSIKGKYQIGSLSNDSDVDYLKIDAGSLTSSKIDKEV